MNVRPDTSPTPLSGQAGPQVPGERKLRSRTPGGLRGTRGLLSPAGIPAQPRPAGSARDATPGSGRGGAGTSPHGAGSARPPQQHRPHSYLLGARGSHPTQREQELPEPGSATPPRPQVVQSPARKFRSGLCLAAGGVPAGSSGGGGRRSRGVPQVSPQVPPQVPPAPLSRCPGSAPRARGNMAA